MRGTIHTSSESGRLLSSPLGEFLTGEFCSADVVAANLASSLFATDPRAKRTWNKFRREILQKGGSEDEYTLLKDFLGYPPDDTTAFFAALGLQPQLA